MNDRRVTLPIINGIRITVPDSLNLITPYVLVEQQDWFEDELRFVRAVLQPGSVAIDIGANYGVYTLSMAHAVGPSGAVYAFEPASRTADFLRESIAANGFLQVVLEQKALSSATGSLPLSLHENSELNSLGSAAATQSGDVEWVEVTTLDACLERLQWSQVDFLKIDAEGEELRILKGAAAFLRKFSPLLEFEIRAGASFNLDMVSELESYGFRFFRLLPSLNVLIPFDPGVPPDPFLLNVFAAKSDCVDRLQNLGHLVTESAPAGETAADFAARWAKPQHHWSQFLAKMPYGQALMPEWLKSMKGRESDEPSLGLNLYGIHCDTELPMTVRAHALEHSLRVFDRLCASGSSKLLEASCARVALDYGSRTTGLQRLGNCLNQLQQAQQVDLSEPFLVPMGRFDQLDPRGQWANWTASALLEALEISGTYSSFYTAGENRGRLEALVTLGFAGPEIERRLQLVRARFPAP